MLFIIIYNKVFLVSDADVLDVFFFIEDNCHVIRQRKRVSPTLFSHLLLYFFFRSLCNNSDLIQTSAKMTDWTVGGKLFKKATSLFSESKPCCTISPWKTLETLDIPDGVSADFPK